MNDSQIENIEDSQPSINTEPDASEDQSDSLSQVREQEARQYHEISSPPLSIGSSAGYMSEADISGNTPLVPLSSAEEEPESLLSDLELDSTSSNSNELVHYCKRGIRQISVVKDVENNLRNPFDTEEEPFEEPATTDADILTLCPDGKSLCEDTNRTAGGHKNTAGYNNDCNQSIIDQINSKESLPPSTPIAKNGKSKKSAQQAITDEIDCKREPSVVLLDSDYQRLRRKFHIVSFAKQCRVINGLRVVMEELEVGLSKRPE